MQALQLDGFVPSLDQLPRTLTTLPIPVPAKGQVLVRVVAVGANFFDILMVQGKYQYRPKGAFTPGAEFAGIIEQVGPGAEGWSVGDRVFGAVQIGAYATHLLADARGILKIPSTLSFRQASGIYLTYPTSYAALVVRANTQPGETVLVHAGAGGVGLAAIQIAKQLGATVIATASSPEKLKVMQENGADHVINYAADDYVKRIMDLTQRRGVDVVFDPVGEIEQSLKVAAWNARLVVVGFAKFPPGGSEKVATNRILLKNVAVMGVFWGNYRIHEPATVVKVWTQLLQWFEAKQLSPVVFPRSFVGLESTLDALTCLGSRESYGKVVVDTQAVAKL